MTEAVFLVASFLIGVLLLFPLRRAVPIFGVTALALPVGLGAYVLTGHLVVAARVAFSPELAVALAAGVAVAAAAYGWRTGIRPTAADGLVVAAAAGVVLALSTLFNAVHLTQLTPDSFRYLIVSSILGQTGGVDAALDADLAKRQLAVPLLHTTATFRGTAHAAAVTPLLGLGGLASLLWLADEGLRLVGAPRRWVPVLLVAPLLLLLSSNRMLFHLFYVNGHLAFAIYLLLAVGMVWLAVMRRQWLLVAPAALALAMLVALRPEGFLVATLVLVPVVASGAVPVRVRWWLVGTTVAAIVVWYGLILEPRVGGGPSSLFSPVSGALAVAAGLVASAAATRWPRLKRLVRSAPVLLLVVMAVALVGFALWDPGRLTASARATAENLLLGRGLWRATWVAVTPLLVVAMAVTRPPWRALWGTSIGGFALLFLLLPYLAEGAYRVGPGGSGNRILLHVLLVAALYLVVATGSLLADRRYRTMPTARQRVSLAA